MLRIIFTVISVLFISPLISGFDISIDAPSKVYVNESFDVEVDIDLEVGESYDIKLFVNVSDSSSSMSEILVDNEWKKQYPNAKYYYTYPDEKEFTLRVFEMKEDTTLCIYLKTSPLSKHCIEIEVEESENGKEANIDEEDNEDEEETTEEDNEEDNEQEYEKEIEIQKSIKEKSQVNIQVNASIQGNIIEEIDINNAPIVLESKNEKSINENKNVIYTKEAKTRILMNYILAGVLLLTLFLISTKRI